MRKRQLVHDGVVDQAGTLSVPVGIPKQIHGLVLLFQQREQIQVMDALLRQNWSQELRTVVRIDDIGFVIGHVFPVQGVLIGRDRENKVNVPGLQIILDYQDIVSQIVKISVRQNIGAQEVL